MVTTVTSLRKRLSSAVKCGVNPAEREGNKDKLVL